MNNIQVLPLFLIAPLFFLRHSRHPLSVECASPVLAPEINNVYIYHIYSQSGSIPTYCFTIPDCVKCFPFLSWIKLKYKIYSI